MPKAPSKTPDFGWKGTVQTNYLGVSLMHLGECMEPVVRALDVGFGHTKFVSSVDGSEVRCAHFPSVAYPTESDETTDPMGGRRKTVGIPIDGLIYVSCSESDLTDTVRSD
jgi:plasmid segregation protein ParM